MVASFPELELSSVVTRSAKDPAVPPAGLLELECAEVSLECGSLGFAVFPLALLELQLLLCFSSVSGMELQESLFFTSSSDVNSELSDGLRPTAADAGS